MIRAHVSIIKTCSDAWLNAGRLCAHPNKKQRGQRASPRTATTIVACAFVSELSSAKRRRPAFFSGWGCSFLHGIFNGDRDLLSYPLTLLRSLLIQRAAYHAMLRLGASLRAAFVPLLAIANASQ